MKNAHSLFLVKLLHTVIWSFFVFLIFYIVYAAIVNLLSWAVWTAILLVFAEGVIIFINDWKCPLTIIAAKYTENRRDNFDIFLPNWLARHNKTIFTLIYLLGVIGILFRKFF